MSYFTFAVLRDGLDRPFLKKQDKEF